MYRKIKSMHSLDYLSTGLFSVISLLLLFLSLFFVVGNTANAQSICGQSSLDESVTINAELNSELNTAELDVELASPPFTDSIVNSFNITPSGPDNESRTISDSLSVDGIQLSYPDSISAFDVTVQVDIDCSGNQGVLTNEEFSFYDGSDNPGIENVSFDYSVSDENDVELTATQPTGGQYSYQWYIDSNPANSESDLSGLDVSFAAGDYASDQLEIDVTLQIQDSDGNVLGANMNTIPTIPGESDNGDDNDDGGGNDDNNDNGGGDDGGGGDGGDGASAGLVNCGDPGADGVLQDSEMCGYDDLINLVSQLIQWLIGILILVATLLFTYAGFLYLFADGNSNQAQKAKNIFTNVASGFAIVLLSVVFITTIVTMFTNTDWEDNWMDVVPLPEVGVQIDTVPLDSNSYS
jgi:hypothetical protein